MTLSRAIIPACSAVLVLVAATLDRLSSRAIPVDVAFTQGKAVLGLN
jgi:hypothetical protein